MRSDTVKPNYNCTQSYVLFRTANSYRFLNEGLTSSARVSGLLHPKLESKTNIPTIMALLSKV